MRERVRKSAAKVKGYGQYSAVFIVVQAGALPLKP
jgi:hypothetical protein